MASALVKPIIAITVGDPNGIGPEVALKCVLSQQVRRLCTPVLVGPPEVFQFYARRLHLSVTLEQFSEAHLQSSRRKMIPIIPLTTGRVSVHPGKISASAGRIASSAIIRAVDLARADTVNGIVTAPVSKKALHAAGISFPGQTEMLQHLTKSGNVAMMLVSDVMRVGLITIHVPIKKVATTLNRRLLRDRITVIHNSLRTDWRIRNPRIAVLGLNPHAGEGGDIGTEEQAIISPVLQGLRRQRMSIDGPFPADAFFGRYTPGAYDGIIAMYHDQGLIPLKMSSFGSAVNFTAGLNVVRTSPDHGTAFDIAGKGIANPQSMIEAISLAVTVAQNRNVRRPS